MAAFSIWGGDDATLFFLRWAQPGITWWPDSENAEALAVMPSCGHMSMSAVHTAVVPAYLPVTAKQVITYGLAQANTLTFSSRRDNGCMLALQRDVTTILGVKLIQQELPLPPTRRPEHMLAVCGTLLLSGCAPALLENLLSQYDC